MLVIELVAELIRDGRLQLSVPVERRATYHDACRLNKRKGIHREPREIMRAIPGLTFEDVDHVTQWGYCSGAGAGLGIERPEITAAISARRVEQAQAARRRPAGVGLRVVGAAAVRAGRRAALEVCDLMELVAHAAGLQPLAGLDVAARAG